MKRRLKKTYFSLSSSPALIAVCCCSVPPSVSTFSAPTFSVSCCPAAPLSVLSVCTSSVVPGLSFFTSFSSFFVSFSSFLSFFPFFFFFLDFDALGSSFFASLSFSSLFSGLSSATLSASSLVEATGVSPEASDPCSSFSTSA